MIFETQRLLIREFTTTDSKYFFDMMGNPNVMNPIPLKTLTRLESDAVLEKFTPPQTEDLEKRVWAVIEKKTFEFIGLCAFLKNDDNENEIGYRLREKFWGNGYGTETAKGLLGYGFSTLKMLKITADVNTSNVNSVKILSKFMTPVKEFFNEEDNCTDRRYQITRENYLN